MIPREAAESFVNQLEPVLTEVLEGADPYVVGERLFQLIRKNEEFIEAIRSRDTLIKFVERRPDEFQAKLPLLTGLYKLAPAIIAKDLMRTIHTIASENPVGVGRPKVIKSDEDKRDIVIAITKLLTECSLTEAQKRIARHNHISLRTVQTIWRSRLDPRRAAHRSGTS